MKLENLLLLIGAGLSVFLFLRWREASVSAGAVADASGAVKVVPGSSAYDGVSIGQGYLDNLYRLAYASGANGP